MNCLLRRITTAANCMPTDSGGVIGRLSDNSGWDSLQGSTLMALCACSLNSVIEIEGEEIPRNYTSHLVTGRVIQVEM